ncbi:AlbA family DNA-binding domain-containing protein [Actinoplanes sp. HUAS TT8]|uniref:AlbA family DNA-binding domain-containing protein n=1 Tax=Actinoplanes sp. HUAS TT8 TaxID=3447453 RepID=UPI003F51B2F6
MEAKRASGGLPKAIRETLSAFSNTDGGTILLGVDEQTDFSVVELADPSALRNSLVQMSRDDITPSLQISAEVVEAEGHRLVVAEVPPLSADRRPAYVTAQGISAGSYLRGGDGDRHMAEAEIAMVMAARTQPLYDREPVDGTSAQDLDDEAIRSTRIWPSRRADGDMRGTSSIPGFLAARSSPIFSPRSLRLKWCPALATCSAAAARPLSSSSSRSPAGLGEQSIITCAS